jgi:Polyketide cyclase / dehydrase and lipid transport
MSVTVPKPVGAVHDFLADFAGRAGYMDHLFTDWSFSGPSAGVGAQARARVKAPGSQEWAEFELLEVEPDRIVEESVSAKGKRRTRSTYLLEELPDGGTRISLELGVLEAPRLEAFGAPVGRAFTRRTYGKALRRLARRLA